MATEFSVNDPAVKAIDDHKWVLTREIVNPSGRLLHVGLAIGIAGKEVDENCPIPNTRSVDITSESKLFSFSFQDYVSYAVTEEMFAQNNGSEDFEGGWIRSYSKSLFLDFVTKSTWASDDFPGRLFHYQVNTLDHTIDVVTPNPPTFVVS